MVCNEQLKAVRRSGRCVWWRHSSWCWLSMALLCCCRRLWAAAARRRRFTQLLQLPVSSAFIQAVNHTTGHSHRYFKKLLLRLHYMNNAC